jgi:serine/threonine protein kinase
MGAASSGVGPFRVLGLLGEGGTARVYLAERAATGRRVALKVLRRALADQPGRRDGLLREAAVTASVGHPNLVALDEAGRLPDGDVFMALEHVSGESLLARIQRDGPRPISEVLAVATQLVAALSALHQQGVLHRDVKSGNVLVSGEREQLRATLIDLGAAVAREAAAARGGAVVGTPLYMAPEQAVGDPLDDRCDVYAFGVVLFEMLTGQVPFEGGRVDEVIRRLVSEPAPRPSEVVAGRRYVAPPLDHLVHRCLAKRPADRPSLAEIGNALAYLNAEYRALEAAIDRAIDDAPRPLSAPVASPAAPPPPAPAPAPASSAPAAPTRLDATLTAIILVVILALGLLGHVALAWLGPDLLAEVFS